MTKPAQLPFQAGKMVLCLIDRPLNVLLGQTWIHCLKSLARLFAETAYFFGDLLFGQALRPKVFFQFRFFRLSGLPGMFRYGGPSVSTALPTRDGVWIVRQSVTSCRVRDILLTQLDTGKSCRENPADTAGKFESLVLTAFAAEPACGKRSRPQQQGKESGNGGEASPLGTAD
jgi:hypothetical protein